jgi:O-antigen/teichoic acid export membrane protein
MTMLKGSHENSLRSRIINGTFWNLIATVSGQGSTFVIGIIIARILQLKQYGEYAIILSTLLSLAGIVQLSIGQTVTKYVAEFRSADIDKVGRILSLCLSVSVLTACLGAIILVTSAHIISDYVLKAPHLYSALIMGSGFLFFSVINGYQMGALAGLEGYQSLAKAGIASAVVTIISVTAGAVFYKLDGAILGLSVSALLRFVLHLIWLKIETYKHNIVLVYFKWKRESRIILHFAIPAAAAGFYSIPAIWLANSILVRQIDGYEQMALFGAAFSIRTFVLFIPNVFNTVGLSVLNHLKGNNQAGQYKRVFKLNVLVILAMTTTAVTIVGVFGESGLGLFGHKFTAGLSILWVLLVATIPESLLIGLSQYLQSQEKIWLTLFSINIPRETMLVILAFILIPKFGALGFAYSYLIVHSVALIIMSAMLFIKFRHDSLLQTCNQ